MNGTCDYPGCDAPAPYYCQAAGCTHEMCAQHQVIKHLASEGTLDTGEDISEPDAHHFCWEHEDRANG